jgi:hypothetical protein
MSFTGFRACPGCPDRAKCLTAFCNRKPVDCQHLKDQRALFMAAHTPAPRPERSLPPVPAPQLGPMTLTEAAQLVVDHWDQYGERAFPAAVEVLRRVLARR